MGTSRANYRGFRGEERGWEFFPIAHGFHASYNGEEVGTIENRKVDWADGVGDRGLVAVSYTRALSSKHILDAFHSTVAELLDPEGDY